MKLTKADSVRQDWDQVKSWNYKLKNLEGYQSVVVAELDGPHGEVNTNDLERIYYILEGEGEFYFNDQNINVSAGDLITVPAKTTYDYQPTNGTKLKIILFMELWDN